MRIRKKKWVDEELEKCTFLIKNPENQKGKWKEIFNNQNPIYLELGCGKGGFASQFGVKNPDKNLIAIDMVPAMLGLAKRKIEKEYLEHNQEINNICIVSQNIERISEIFSEDDKIQRIYINFCNPWPRGKHKKRRLTHPRQLEQYKAFLVPNGEIFFKTDDDELFEESLEYFEEQGFEILEMTRNLHNCDNNNSESSNDNCHTTNSCNIETLKQNIVTEHEKMFSDEGIKIKFLRAKY